MGRNFHYAGPFRRYPRATGSRARWAADQRDSRGHLCRRRFFMHEGSKACMTTLEAEMDVYVFANQKGGVGKTTVTLGVAAELAARGAQVLLIDLDAQASATKVLDIELVDGCSMADVMLEPDRYTLGDAIASTDWGFDLAPSETALASRESRRATADEFVLKRQLEGVADYDVVL